MRQVKNIVSNAIRLGTGKELARKALKKCVSPTSDKSKIEDWCRTNCSNIEDWIEPKHQSLWVEAKDFAERTTEQGRKKLDQLGVELGGGGHYGLLYFLTRTRRPNKVVETGVAAGFSSRAILTAMKENARGHLYSSDFPYCRLDEPEKYIGILVPEALKDRWKLHIQGDRANLPLIAKSLEPDSVDLFHYDSDKSTSGRSFAYNLLRPYLAPEYICIFDDIQNNWHFRNLVESQPFDWRVFEFGGKYLGLIQKAREK